MTKHAGHTGEPRYLTKGSSTIRMDWKDRTPDQYAMYFNCNTALVNTFKAVYGDVFTFEGNRAIVFGEIDGLPVNALKHCISLALTYHRVKHLPLLGVWLTHSVAGLQEASHEQD